MSKYNQRKKRISGTTLQNIRKEYARLRPMCEWCLKKNPPVYKLWEELDHVIPLNKDGEDSRNPFVNRQGLCKPCHKKKTAKDGGFFVKPTIGADGWPIVTED